jgi:hypothetical protein
MNPQYAEVARRAGHRCEYCRAPEIIFNFPFEVEQIVGMAFGSCRLSVVLFCRLFLGGRQEK